MAVALLIAATSLHAGDVPTSTLVFRLGVDASGAASEDWRAILQRRLSQEEYEEVAELRHPLTDDDRAWEALIRSRRPEWSEATSAIAALYAPAPPPERVAIVLGNRGANDAFTHDPSTMGFDLAALETAYGSATLPVNTERIDRLFTHEYAHLMQKSWVRDHPYDANTPLRVALLGIWLEGLGNVHSMSERWRATDGVTSEKSKATLEVLQPRFIARLAAITCADDDAIAGLTADLSKGRFDRKWGALTVALWLDQEMSLDRSAYRRLVEDGPDGVIDLAHRHLPNNLAAVLDETLGAEKICHAPSEN